MPTDYEIGEFDDDGALDERDNLIDWIVRRIDESTNSEGFCSVDISGVRANISILATIIRSYGGGHLIKRSQVEEWAQRVDEPFVANKLWGFTPWPDAIKQEWREVCKETVNRLLHVLEK